MPLVVGLPGITLEPDERAANLVEVCQLTPAPGQEAEESPEKVAHEEPCLARGRLDAGKLGLDVVQVRCGELPSGPVSLLSGQILAAIAQRLHEGQRELGQRLRLG